jgi:hypothetical protein
MKYRKRILSQDRRPGKPVGKYQPPPPQETPTEVAPQGVTTVFGPLTTRTIATGPRRGDLEQLLRHLQGLAGDPDDALPSSGIPSSLTR